MSLKINFFNLIGASMKRLLLVAAVSCAIILPSCKKGTSKTAIDYTSTKSKFSYAVGWNIGQSIAEAKSMIDVNTLKAGIEDQLNKQNCRLKPEEIQQVMQEVSMKLSAEKTQAEDKFFAENKSKPGIVTTPSGLQYQVMTEGKGPKALPTSMVKVHYRGTLLDGKEFDSSYKRGQPVEFPVNGVIPGWTEALQLMNVGSRYKLFIPSKLGYGERGTPGGPIPPNATLMFEVELLDINNNAPAPTGMPGGAR